MEFDSGTFAKGFVARLITEGASAIVPRRRADRLGFQRVLGILDERIALAREQPLQRDWYKQLVRLRNELSPSNNGAFDNFESALRDLQLSLTSSPNPFYEEILFSVSAPFAHAIFEELEEGPKDIVNRSAEAFLEARTEAA